MKLRKRSPCLWPETKIKSDFKFNEKYSVWPLLKQCKKLGIIHLLTEADLSSDYKLERPGSLIPLLYSSIYGLFFKKISYLLSLIDQVYIPKFNTLTVRQITLHEILRNPWYLIHKPHKDIGFCQSISKQIIFNLRPMDLTSTVLTTRV